MQLPKVSIVIPVYNGSNFLKDAIDSALAQTYKNIEVLVINDGSTDDGKTEAIAKSYGDKIRYFKKENGGVATALNFAIGKMKGDYFSWLSHDDVYKPNKVAKQVDYITKLGNDRVVIYADYDLIDSRGGLIAKVALDHDMLEEKKAYALLRGSVNGITMLIPRAAFLEHGDFDVSLRCTQDYDMWQRMMKTYRFVHMRGTYSKTRIHGDQGTVSDPAAISEGDTLWIGLIKGLEDRDKISYEGSLILFYVEMVRFLSGTEYKKALEYCESVISELVNSPERRIDHNVERTYELLIEVDLLRSAAVYLANVIKDDKRNHDGRLADLLTQKYLYCMPSSAQINPICKKRVMFCSGQWLSGGMERVLSVLLGELTAEYDVFLLTPRADKEGKIPIPKGVTRITINKDDFYTKKYELIALTCALVYKIDAIVGFMHLSGRQLRLYELCRGTGIFTIASNHESYFYPYEDPNCYEVIQDRLNVFKHVDAVLWPLNYSAMVYGIEAENSYLMPNPNSYAVQKRAMLKDEKVVLCVGRFNDPIKRIDLILKTFAEIVKTNKNARLVLVGQCDRDALIKLDKNTTINNIIREHRIDANKIEFIGEIDNVEQFYARASVLLLTSKSEGFGMVINEAACFGVPSVCAGIPGIDELIDDGINGYIVKDSDAKIMAHRVCNLLSDNVLYQNMSLNAKKRAGKYDRSVIANRWRLLIDTILSDVQRQAKQRKLQSCLGYSAPDNEVVVKLLFEELGRVISSNIEFERAGRIHERRTLKRYVARTIDSAKRKGVIPTGKMAAVLIRKKLSSLLGF